MRSFSSWIRIDIHWVWELSNLLLRSLDHCLHYHPSLLIRFSLVVLIWVGHHSLHFLAYPLRFPSSLFMLVIPYLFLFLHWYTSLIYYPLHIHHILYWQPDHFSFLLYFIADTFIVCYRVCWLTRLFCTLYLIHEGIRFDHWVLKLSFPSFLSPYYPRPTLRSVS